MAAAKNGGASAAAALFSEEELRGISGVRRGEDFVEMPCGCTSRRYGDAVGRLRVYASGELEIECECTPACCEGKLTPSDFEKHSRGDTPPGKWKNTVWVTVGEKKVSLSKTALLKYYNATHKSTSGRPSHRDEFIRCTSCGKDRRFRLGRSKDECRVYHDALAKVNWTCADLRTTNNRVVTCDDDEERATRKVLRGCPRAPTCPGCLKCVCFGCETCRFKDCSCRTCVDFYRNSEE